MNNVSEKILIIGTGAIGKALAVCLKLAGRDVELIRGSVSSVEKKIEHIKMELWDGSTNEVAISVSTLSDHVSLNGLVVLTNKSFGNEHLANTLKDKIGQSPLVLLQNGLGVEDPFIDRNFSQVYRCVLFVTSQSINGTTVRFKPVADCPVGLVKGDLDKTGNIVEILNTKAFAFKIENNINTIVWKKTIANCVFNSICPLLDADNGIFHRNAQALKFARKVISECIEIAQLSGIILDATEVELTLLQISKSSDGQLISTLQDIRNHRRTEIDTLNFAIVAIAERFNKMNAVTTTKLLGELTKIKADLNLQNTD